MFSNFHMYVNSYYTRTHHSTYTRTRTRTHIRTYICTLRTYSQGNRRIALCTVVGILEDGETYSTELKLRQSPGAGKMGQWEHELVCQRYVRTFVLMFSSLIFYLHIVLQYSAINRANYISTSLNKNTYVLVRTVRTTQC